MSAKITQENLYLLLPLKIGWLAAWLSEDKGISIADAVKRVYHSQLYKNCLPQAQCIGIWDRLTCTMN